MPFSLHEHVNRAKIKVVPNDKFGKREFLELAPQAVCFDLGTIRDDQMEDLGIDGPIAEKLFKNKQIPFPAHICWLESDQQIILIDTRSPKIFRVQLHWPNVNSYFGIWKTYNYETQLCSSQILDKFIDDNRKKRQPKEEMKDIIGPIMMAVGFTLLMNSQKVIMSEPKEIVAPPMEMPMGDEPIEYQKYIYRKVELRTIKIPETKIIPAEPITHQQYDPDDALYHQRYHYRRGHYRYLRDGRKIKVKGCYAGNIGLGEIKHDYDCTELVAQRSTRDLFSDGRLVWTKPKIFQDLFA
jgi:hypothetical protein